MYDNEYLESISLARGSEVNVYNDDIIYEDTIYKKIKYDEKEYLVNVNNLVKDSEEVVKENTLYVRTSSVSLT